MLQPIFPGLSAVRALEDAVAGSRKERCRYARVDGERCHVKTRKARADAALRNSLAPVLFSMNFPFVELRITGHESVAYQFVIRNSTLVAAEAAAY